MMFGVVMLVTMASFVVGSDDSGEAVRHVQCAMDVIVLIIVNRIGIWNDDEADEHGVEEVVVCLRESTRTVSSSNRSCAS